MDTSSKSATRELQRAKKTRICADGTKCPKNTYLRYAEKQQAYVYYAKIKVRGVESELNTGILESTPGSREAVACYVAQYGRQLLDAQYERTNELLRAQREDQNPHGIVVTSASKRWISYVTSLELARYRRLNGEESPAYRSVEIRVARLCAYFGPDRDVSTITREEFDEYGSARRKEKRHGRQITWDSIRRELAHLKQGVTEANKYGVFNPPIMLPIDSKELTKLVKQNKRVNVKQESHQYTHNDCMAWLEAAKGTRMESFALIAYATGMRSGELQALRWSWIHATPDSQYAAMIYLPEYLYKDSDVDPRPIPLSEDVYAYLKRIAATRGPDDLLLGKVHNAFDLSQAVARRSGRTFVSINVNNTGRPYESTHMTLRDLRASAGRRTYDRTGGNLLATMHFMRHKDIKTTTGHYVRSSRDEMELIAKSMEGIV